MTGHPGPAQCFRRSTGASEPAQHSTRQPYAPHKVAVLGNAGAQLTQPPQPPPSLPLHIQRHPLPLHGSRAHAPRDAALSSTRSRAHLTAVPSAHTYGHASGPQVVGQVPVSDYCRSPGRHPYQRGTEQRRRQ